MIVVQATLISAADGRRESLGYLTISNDGTGNHTRRNYVIELYSRGKKPRVVRKARLENWPSNAKTAMQLAMAAIKEIDK